MEITTLLNLLYISCASAVLLIVLFLFVRGFHIRNFIGLIYSILIVGSLWIVGYLVNGDRSLSIAVFIMYSASPVLTASYSIYIAIWLEKRRNEFVKKTKN